MSNYYAQRAMRRIVTLVPAPISFIKIGKKKYKYYTFKKLMTVRCIDSTEILHHFKRFLLLFQPKNKNDFRKNITIFCSYYHILFNNKL